MTVKLGSKGAILPAHAIVEIATVCSVTASGVPLSANFARPVALKVIRRLKLEHLVAQEPEDTLDGAQLKLQLLRRSPSARFLQMCRSLTSKSCFGL